MRLLVDQIFNLFRPWIGVFLSVCRSLFVLPCLVLGSPVFPHSAGAKFRFWKVSKMTLGLVDICIFFSFPFCCFRSVELDCAFLLISFFSTSS